MAKNSQQSGQVRIISGQWRSRRLPIKELAGLRPTTDRIRETLFNWLANHTVNARVLDCFAGSGALAFEALSRYASYARIFELQKQAVKQLEQNLAKLNCQNADVIQGDSITLLSKGISFNTKNDHQNSYGFDMVFIDPPFRKGLAQACIDGLNQDQWLNHDALIYVETESELAALNCPASWELIKQKIAGQVCSRLYHYQGV